MRVEYDEIADAAYFKLANSQIVESEEVFPGIVYDFDKNEQVVGIEILNLKYRTPEQLKQFNFPFAEEDKTQLRELFSRLMYSL